DRRGSLPSDVAIWYWFDGDPVSLARSHSMIYAGGRMMHRLSQVHKSFHYRATGGDDQTMPWLRLEVVEPPRVTQAILQVHPPKYTGIAPYSAEVRVHGLVGSRVSVAAEVDKPIQSARLELSEPSRESLSAEIAEDGRRFLLRADAEPGWRLTESGTYRWALVDRDDQVVSWDTPAAIDVVADSPPQLAIESPRPDTSYTPGADIPFRLVVKDDLAIQNALLRVAGQQRVIFESATPPSAQPPETWPPHGHQQIVDGAVALKELADVVPGQSIKLQWVATDYMPQESLPVEVTIQIITLEEWMKRAERRQTTLLQQLHAALQLQRTVRTQTSSASVPRAVEAASAVDASVDTAPGSVAWPAIELGQQRVRGLLDEEQGALAIVQQLLGEHASNHVADLQLAGHLMELQQRLQRVVTEDLLPIERRLRSIVQQGNQQVGNAAAGGKGKSSEGADPPSTILAGQQRAILALEELVDQLSQWSGYRLLAQEVSDLASAQEELQLATRSLPTAARDLLALSADERGALHHLGDRQHQMASQLDRLQQRLERMRQELGNSNPLAAATMDEALRRLRDSGMSAEMRSAASQIQQNRIGVAAASQQNVLAGLRTLFETLSESADRDDGQLAEELRTAASRSRGLLQRQTHAADQAEATAGMSETERAAALAEIQRTEEEIGTGVHELERRLHQLRQSQAAQSLEESSSALSSAAAAAGRRDGTATTAAAREAARLLNEVSRKLAHDARMLDESRQQADRRLLMQQLHVLKAEQELLIQDTQRTGTDPAQSTEGNTRPSLAALATRQRQAADSAEAMAQRETSLPAVSQGLRSAARSMRRAETGLASGHADEVVTGLQHLAARRLQLLLDALSISDMPDDTPRDAPEGASPDAPTPENESPNRISREEILFLKSWQQEINRRTEELARAGTAEQPLASAQERELQELAQEQEQVASALEQLLSDAAGPEPEEER
ncbi:MAG: hypothetical protein AB7F89_13810, partial [Pirellulaceae bacterium]